jgi:hypothetical protein
MDIAVQLDVPYILHAEFALALPVIFNVLARATGKPGFFFQTIDVLGVRAEKLLFLVKRAKKMMRARRGSRINRLLQLRDERVEY